MYLNETSNVKEWLNQFLDEDRPYAEILIDSLTLISQQTLVRELTELIVDASKDVDKPIALVPVREMAEKQSYYKPINNRDAKANMLLPNSFPGSEAIIANLMTNLKRLNREDFVASPSLKNMRDARCRSVFFIDDFVGSGKRICDFIPSYCMNKTIKSWGSYNYLKFHLLSYSSTISGNKKAHQSKLFSSIRYVIKCPTFYDQEWTILQQKQIRKICLRYAAHNEEMALGFKGTMGLLVFEHSVPNNLPGIFWKKDNKWKPLFPDRSVPNDLKICFSQTSIEHNIVNILKKIGQKRLSDGQWLMEATPYIKKIILVLSVIAKKTRKLEKISDYTKLSTIEVKKIIIYCRDWGLIDEYNSLTANGLKELNYARKMKINSDMVLDTKEDFYYPAQLRGVDRH